MGFKGFEIFFFLFQKFRRVLKVFEDFRGFLKGLEKRNYFRDNTLESLASLDLEIKPIKAVPMNFVRFSKTRWDSKRRFNSEKHNEKHRQGFLQSV